MLELFFMRLYNTASRKIEEFKPINSPNVSFYTCGPTVYDFTHIGHLRTYVNNDVLKRTLNFLGYKVKHAMNITDVGHLTGDSDEGEDKMEKGAVKKATTVWELAKVYTDYFIYSIDELKILRPDTFSNATAHVPEFIEMIKILEKKGFVYQTDEAVYFDVKKFPNYGKLSGQKLEDKKTAVRKEVNADAGKKNPADFALWFKAVGRFKDHTMRWESPWGVGFPGWHIECSAMCMKYLGETIDIHTGGIDHIAVHHENEIAQSEAVTGKPFVHYWFHYDFLLVDGQKMSKSLGNFYTIDDIKKRNINPLALRMLFFQTHYQQIMNFTWESLDSAQTAYARLQNIIVDLKEKTEQNEVEGEISSEAKKLKIDFTNAISDNLQMPKAMAILWETVKSKISDKEKLNLLLDFDQILGLGFKDMKKETGNIPEGILKLAQEREKARLAKNFNRSDEIRKMIEERGYQVKDADSGFEIKRK